LVGLLSDVMNQYPWSRLVSMVSVTFVALSRVFVRCQGIFHTEFRYTLDAFLQISVAWASRHRPWLPVAHFVRLSGQHTKSQLSVTVHTGIYSWAGGKKKTWHCCWFSKLNFHIVHYSKYKQKYLFL